VESTRSQPSWQTRWLIVGVALFAIVTAPTAVGQSVGGALDAFVTFLTAVTPDREVGGDDGSSPASEFLQPDGTIATPGEVFDQ
jgi:hypothetical protein